MQFTHIDRVSQYIAKEAFKGTYTKRKRNSMATSVHKGDEHAKQGDEPTNSIYIPLTTVLAYNYIQLQILQTRILVATSIRYSSWLHTRKGGQSILMYLIAMVTGISTFKILKVFSRLLIYPLFIYFVFSEQCFYVQRIAHYIPPSQLPNVAQRYAYLYLQACTNSTCSWLL